MRHPIRHDTRSRAQRRRRAAGPLIRPATAAPRLALWLLLLGLATPGCGDDDTGPTNQNNTSTQSVCGDGVLDPGEQCDDGAANSDTAPDACRTTCRLAYCGDGVTDPGNGEACDMGSGNSDLVPNACRSDCSLPRCGDGIVDDGEACDAGEQNADSGGAPCRTTCVLPACGDGIVDPGQVCYAYAGSPSPQGFLLPVDLDEDGLADLAGPDARFQRVLRVARNQGGNLAPARGHLLNYGGYDVPVPILHQGDGSRWLAMGASPVLMARLDTDGQPALPAAIGLPRPIPDTGGLPVVTPFKSGGVRRASVFSPEVDMHCTVSLDATGFVDASLDCEYVSGVLQNFVVVDTEPGWALPCGSGGHTAIVYSLLDDSGAPRNPGYLLIELDEMGRLVRAESRLVDLALGVGEFGLVAVRQAKANGSVFRFDFKGLTTSANVTAYAWNPNLCAFEEGTPELSLSVSFNYAPDERLGWPLLPFATGELDGQTNQSGWLDWVVGAGPAVCFVTDIKVSPNPPATSTQGCLDLAMDPAVYSVAALSSGTVVAYGENDGVGRIAVMRQDSAQVSVAIDNLPRGLGLLHVGDFDGSGNDQVLLVPWGMPWHRDLSPYGGLLWRNPASPPPASLDVVPLPVSTDVVKGLPFPKIGAPGGDLLFLVGEPNEAVLALVPSDGGTFRAPGLVGSGSSTAYVPVDPFLGDSPFHFAEDLDGDGNEDLLLVSGARLLAFMGPYDPETGFASAHEVPLPYPPGYAFYADVTGGPEKDLVLIRTNPVVEENTPDSTVTIIEGRAGGAFDSDHPIVIDTLYYPVFVALGDLDGDGDRDLVSVHRNVGALVVIWNDGSGGFHYDPGKDVHLMPGSVTGAWIADLDLDGVVDIVASAPSEGAGPLWLRGIPDPADPARPTGTFEQPVDLPLTANEFAVLPAEVSGTPPLDLVIVRQVASRWGTLLLHADP